MKKHGCLLCAILLYTFLLVYLFLLLNVLIFQRINFEGEQYVMRSINIIPFHSIGAYLSQFISDINRDAFTNILWNILMFAPLGLYLPVIKGNKKMATYLCWIFLFSLSAEILQLILGIGVADIDDIILNCFGGLLGLISHKILLLFVKNEYRVRVFTAIISTAVGIPVLYIAIGTYLYNR